MSSNDHRPDPGAPSEFSASRALLAHVAELTGREITNLPPLYETLDPDALDRLVESVDAGYDTLSIQITYAGHKLVIDGEGAVSSLRV